MEPADAMRAMRRHLALSRRIRALDPKKDSSEFAEGRLRDYEARTDELARLQADSPDRIAALSGLISVSRKLLQLKRSQFSLPVPHGGDDDRGLADGGAAVPSLLPRGPFTLRGSGGRLFSESEECLDW